MAHEEEHGTHTRSTVHIRGENTQIQGVLTLGTEIQRGLPLRCREWYLPSGVFGYISYRTITVEKFDMNTFDDHWEILSVESRFTTF